MATQLSNYILNGTTSELDKAIQGSVINFATNEFHTIYSAVFATDGYNNVEATDARLDFTPKRSDSIILIEYHFQCDAVINTNAYGFLTIEMDALGSPEISSVSFGCENSSGKYSVSGSLYYNNISTSTKQIRAYISCLSNGTLSAGINQGIVDRYSSIIVREIK